MQASLLQALPREPGPPGDPAGKGLEEKLAARLMAGDAEALDRFIEIFRSKVFGYSWTMCGQREDAEEVAQETLLRVFQNWSQLRDPSTIRPWVFRIAKNVCLTKRRKSAFAPSAEISLDSLMPERDDRGQLQIADWSALPDDVAMRREAAEALREAIAALPDIYKQVLLLRDMEELSTEETASALEINEDAVKTRLHRARLAVRKTLDHRFRGVATVARNGGTHGQPTREL